MKLLHVFKYNTFFDRIWTKLSKETRKYYRFRGFEERDALELLTTVKTTTATPNKLQP